jgi:putative phosphoribosyl transferase
MTSRVVTESVEQVAAGEVTLAADLTLVSDVRGVVLFAHGSGRSRHSLRNRRVAAAVQRAGWATLLLDLLTADEDALDQRTREFRFDIDMLATRLTAAADWLTTRRETRLSPIAVFGASTGAAAALVAAADRPDLIRLVISRGGRPDLAGAALPRVAAPTVLIVGGADHEVLRLNQQAAAAMRAEVDLHVVPAATHLFPEPGALDDVIDLTVAALARHLPSWNTRSTP